MAIYAAKCVCGSEVSVSYGVDFHKWQDNHNTEHAERVIALHNQQPKEEPLPEPCSVCGKPLHDAIISPNKRRVSHTIFIREGDSGGGLQ